MTFGYNCKLFGRLASIGAVGYSDKGTMIKRCNLHIRTSSGKLIFALGPCEYEDDQKFIDEWNKLVIQNTFGLPEGYPEPDPCKGATYIQNIDEKLLNNAYLEISWFSILEIKEYYAKIIITKSDIELLKEFALNDGWDYNSIATGKEATPLVLKEVNFIMRLSAGGIGFINVQRNLSDEYFFKHILGVAKDDQKQISRIQKLTQLKDLDYAKFFKDQYKDPDFLKTFQQARKIAKEANSDISKCYPFNNYGSIITSLRKSTNIYKYKLNINRKYKIAYLEIFTTAQEKIDLIGKEIFEKTFIAAPIEGLFAIIEIPNKNGKKVWKEMQFRFLNEYISSCSSPNKNDKETVIEYFKNLDELSGYPEIIGNKITVDQKGVNSIIDRKIYERLTLITYSITLDFENDELELFIHNDQIDLPCPFSRAFVDGNFKHIPVFPKGTEID